MTDNANEPVRRIARRRALPHCAEAYEAVLRGMFADMRGFKGFQGAEYIPPTEAGGEHQVIVRFSTAADLAAWDASPLHATWMERTRTVAEGDPEYRLLSGLEAWFPQTVVSGPKPPPRSRMAIITWLGIFPTVTLLQLIVAPFLAPLPLVLRMAVFTMLVVALMTWVVMPQLTRLLRGWITRN